MNIQTALSWVPRPIGWISTISPDGSSRNLAPFSQITNVTFDPHYLLFCANQDEITGGRKDTTINVEQTGRFCWNMATYDLRDAVNASAESVPYDVDEFERAGVTPIKSELLGDCPMVKESPIRFECQYHSTLRLPGNPPMGTVDIIIGRVIGIHIAEEALRPNGQIDVLRIRPIARCGYYEYTVINEIFEMRIPGNETILRGLEGSAALNAKTHQENQKRRAESQTKVTATEVEHK